MGRAKQYVRFERIDIPFVLACLLLFLLGLVLVSTLAPTSGFWPPTFSEWVRVIRNLALIVGGVLGFILAIWRLLLSDRQVGTSESDHLEGRYETAVKDLESDSEISRASGAATIEQLAFEHPDRFFDRNSVLLCTYMRRSLPIGSKQLISNAEIEQLITAIHRMLTASESTYPSKTDVRYDLRGVNFEGQTLDSWPFERVRMDGASFKDARLYRCTITSSSTNNTSFEDATFEECEFSGDFFNLKFDRARFTRCSLNQVVFIVCKFVKSHFEGTRVVPVQEEGPLGAGTFQICTIDNLTISKDSSPGGSKSSFRSRDFTQCILNDDKNIPKDADENDPPLRFIYRTVTSRLSPDGKHKFVVATRKDTEDANYPDL